MTKYQGTYGELIVAAACSNKGLAVFKEIGENSRIDLIVQDTSGTLHKVQVKCVNRKNNKSKLNLTKSGFNGYRYTYTVNDVDWFALVDNETGNIAWISSEEACGYSNCLNLRHSKCENNQTKDIKMFSDYTDFPFI